jgi:hypothetical protein
MMETLKGAYSNFRPNENPDQLRTYGEGFKRMVADFGMARTAIAIDKAVDYVPDFCPTIAKIREFVPPKEGQVKTCTLCHPSGFVEVEKPAHWFETSSPPVQRCTHEGGKSPVVDVAQSGEHQYSANDVKVLWKLFNDKRAKLGRPLTEDERDDLLVELDVKTGRVWDNFPG